MWTYAMGWRGRSWGRAEEWTAKLQKLHEGATNLANIGLTKQGFTLKNAGCAGNSVKNAETAIRSANPSQRAQPGYQPSGQPDHGEGGGATEHHRGHGADEPRRDPGLERAELVRRADEDGVDRRNAPEHLGGRQQLDERGPDDDAHVIGHSAQRKEREGEVKVARESEADDGEREDGHGEEHRPARASEGRAVREEDPHGDGARGRGGTEHSEALRPDMKDLRREHGKQRFGAAEEDGEEVERERGEDGVLAPHEAQPRKQLLEHRRTPERARLGRIAHHEEGAERDEHEQRGEYIGSDGAGEAVEQAADGRPDHRGDLPGAAAPGDGVLIEAARDDLGAERLPCRLEDAPRDAAREDDGVDGHDPDAREQTRGRAEGDEGRRATGEDEQHRDTDRAPVATVGEISGGKRDADEGQRLGEPDEAERERVAREIVDLPADDDGLGLRADDHREQADDEPPEVAVAEGGVGVVGLNGGEVGGGVEFAHPAQDDGVGGGGGGVVGNAPRDAFTQNPPLSTPHPLRTVPSFAASAREQYIPSPA